jgi:acyl-CoA synthetase (AMP-forming)/AMP-acid ligase II
MDELTRAWSAVLRRRGDDVAVLDASGAALRTFADIDAEAERLREESLGELAAGTVVAIPIGNHATWPALLVACLRQRLVVLPLERGIAEQERENAFRICHVAAVVQEEASGALTVVRRSAESVEWDEHPPVLLKLTSGTTAAPRAIRFRSAQLLADCEQICDTMGITEGDLNFAVIPVSHSYGFSNLLTPLIARGVPMALSRDRLPRAVLEGLAATRATVFPGMPVFYQSFCELERPPELPHLRLCLSAGAPLPLAVAQKFRARFGQPIHSFYGSSECGGICYDRAAPLTEQGFVGSPMNGVRLELLEPEATISRVRVHTAAAGDAYFPEPQPEKLGGGTFTPDDLLVQSGDGYRIAGRVSDVINVAGKKVNPAEVEATLLACEGVTAAVVFGRASTLRNEEVAACVVAGGVIAEPELLQFCRERLSGWQVPKRIFFLDALPVNERGKINRRALAERFAA